MRNLDITDTRAKLETYARAGLLSLGSAAMQPRLASEEGGNDKGTDGDKSSS